MRDQRLWTWHVLAGLVIFVLLGLHMAVMHLDTLLGWFNPAEMKPIAWDSVIQRARMGFFTVTYIVLLGAALFHGLYGLRNILFEFGIGAGAKKGLNLLLAAGGVALFVYGAWAAWAAGALARTL
jgi:succinate dehydrogenase/fumarate reductase cytochrome b subunit